jgi:hypothetical protein
MSVALVPVEQSATRDLKPGHAKLATATQEVRRANLDASISGRKEPKDTIIDILDLEDMTPMLIAMHM